MKLDVTRRDVLRFTGGAAVGVALSPLPWNLTDDLAIWTQNWSWIPRPRRGERSVRATRCALCPTGCPIEARCVGGLPVSLHSPADGEPICPLGMTGHHLPHHPGRLAGAVRVARGELRPTPMTTEAAIAETAGALASARAGRGSVVVLDTRPGRSISWAWRRLLGSVPGSAVVAAPGLDGASLTTLDAILGSPAQSFGLDLRNARAILSFGAPIAEGWGGLARSLGRDSVRLTQVEPVRSRTAESADRWLPARPGTEAALALGIANVLLNDGLVDATAASKADDFASYASTVSCFPVDKVAAITGLVPDDIVATARELVTYGPTVVVAGEQPGGGPLGQTAETAILGLNVLLGSIDREGGIVRRAELPPPNDDGPLAPIVPLESIPDRSVSLLIVDASAGDSAFPWPMVERTLVSKGAVVVALSPFLAGSALHADLVLGTPPYLEAIHELPTPFDSPTPSFALSAPLLPARNGAVDPVVFLRAAGRVAKLDLGGDWSTSEALIRARGARIHASGEGSVTSMTDGRTTSIAELATPEDFHEALLAGGRWNGSRATKPHQRSITLTGGLGDALGELPSRVTTAPRSPETLTLMARATRDTTATAAVSPLLTKLYQESGLRRSPGSAVVNPRTAATLGFRAGEYVRLLTGSGSMPVALALDESVMPGVVEVTVAPDRVALGERRAPGARAMLDLLAAEDRRTWLATDAQLLEG